MVVWTVLGQLEMVQAPEMVGPAADVMRPGERPVQARALNLPASVNRKWLQDDLDLIWNLRRALPPKPTDTDLMGFHWKSTGLEEADLGLGLRRRQRRSAGGHLTCDTTAVVFPRRSSRWERIAVRAESPQPVPRRQKRCARRAVSTCFATFRNRACRS